MIVERRSGESRSWLDEGDATMHSAVLFGCVSCDRSVNLPSLAPMTTLRPEHFDVRAARLAEVRTAAHRSGRRAAPRVRSHLLPEGLWRPQPRAAIGIRTSMFSVRTATAPASSSAGLAVARVPQL